MTDRERIISAINLITKYGMIDGAHHKQWLLAQVVRKLLGDFDYKIWAHNHWDEGIAP